MASGRAPASPCPAEPDTARFSLPAHCALYYNGRRRSSQLGMQGHEY